MDILDHITVGSYGWPSSVGLANFRNAIGNPTFPRALWNTLVYGLTFIGTSVKFTVSVGVPTFLVRGDVFQWGSLMAGALIAGLPVPGGGEVTSRASSPHRGPGRLRGLPSPGGIMIRWRIVCSP
jgi:ABC-type glycerol-3-phosphate transport system permease component